MSLRLTGHLFPSTFDVESQGGRVVHCKREPHYRWCVVNQSTIYLDNRIGYSQPLVKALKVMTVVLQKNVVERDELEKLRDYVRLKARRYEETHGWLYKYLFAQGLEEIKKDFEDVVEGKLRASASTSIAEEKIKDDEAVLQPSVDSVPVEEPPPPLRVDWLSILGDAEQIKSKLVEHCTAPKYLSDGFLLWSALIRHDVVDSFAVKMGEFVAKYIKIDPRTQAGKKQYQVISTTLGLVIQGRCRFNDWHARTFSYTHDYSGTVSVYATDPFSIGSWNDLFFTLLSMLAGQVCRYRTIPLFSTEYIGYFKNARVNELCSAFQNMKVQLTNAESKLLEWLRLVDQWVFTVADAKDEEEEKIRAQLEIDRQFVETLSKTWLNTAVNVLWVPGAEKAIKTVVKRYVLPPPPDIEGEERRELETQKEQLKKIPECLQGLEVASSLEEYLEHAKNYSDYLYQFWMNHSDRLSKENVMIWLRQEQERISKDILYRERIIAASEFKVIVDNLRNFYQDVGVPIIHATIDQHEVYYIIYAIALYRDAIKARALWYAERLNMHQKEAESQNAYERACQTRDSSLIATKNSELKACRIQAQAAIREKEVLYEAAKKKFYPIFLTAVKKLYLELEGNPLVRQFLSELDQALPHYSLPEKSYDFSNDLFNRVLFPVLERMIGVDHLFPRTISE